jgi:hypothetical protein
MTLPDLVHHNPARFSLISCVTEDSIESAAIATPLDASPPPPPSNTFSIINIVNDDPFPNLRAYPAIASTYNRRRAQTSPRPVPSSILITTPQEQPIIVYDNNEVVTEEQPRSSNKLTKLWPRIKRIMTSNSNTDKMKQLFESMNISSTSINNEKIETSSNKPKQEQEQQQPKNNKRWLGRNRARVGPQR